MSDYVRPPLPKQVFYDAAGIVIDYGNRWRDPPGRMPPEDTYSVISHPERFAPLHAVADALMAHFNQDFMVGIIEDPSLAADFMRQPENVLRVTRVVPANPDGASMTFVFNSYPSVGVHAGLLHDFWFPGCGCDACDESVESAAADLESTALAVAEGRYKETAGTGISPLNLLGLDVGYEIDSANGGHRSHRSRVADYSDERLLATRTRLKELPRGWQPWARPA